MSAPIARQRKVATISRDWRSRTFAAVAPSVFQHPAAAAGTAAKSDAAATTPAASFVDVRIPLLPTLAALRLESEASHPAVTEWLRSEVNGNQALRRH